MNNYRYGTECYICHAKNPEGRYLPHEGRFYFCSKHTRQEIQDWESQPASKDPAAVKLGRTLTDEQIRAIGKLLHKHIQFYGSIGELANDEVIAQIEATLKENELPAICETRNVSCLKCEQQIPYTLGTCPYCAHKEF